MEVLAANKISTDFQTPKPVARYMASLIPDGTKTVLEPTPGVGHILKDNFILSTFLNIIQSHNLFPELTLLLYEIGEFRSVQLLQKERGRDLKEQKLGQIINGVPQACAACGYKPMKIIKKYHYLKCGVCNWTIYYGEDPNDKTKAR